MNTVVLFHRFLVFLLVVPTPVIRKWIRRFRTISSFTVLRSSTRAKLKWNAGLNRLNVLNPAQQLDDAFSQWRRISRWREG
jgi:hypothetical protein